MKECCFAGPQFEVNDNVHFCFVTFVGKHLAIECSLDGREGDIACIIARVVDGKRATFYDAIDELDETGARVRVHLDSLLRRRGVRERLLTPSGQLPLRERIKVRLADFAMMLRKHGQEVLSDSPTVFD